MAVLGIVAGDEVVEVAALERIFFEGEMFVCAQIVNPELLCPRFLGCGFAIEEEDVRLDALGVEDARGQAQQCVYVGLFEQLTSYGFAAPPSKRTLSGTTIAA